ncbi:MAG TPA: hypothetical protein VLI40_04605 [Gemmatimonadaceae bacterium]|nr:hypothetical protein [Gemmatimonadaceae bacterium]
MGFQFAGGYAQRTDGYFHATSRYDVTLRFSQIANLVLNGFLAENIVAELQLALIDPATHDGRTLAVTVEGIRGFGCDLAFDCTAMEVVAVLGPYLPAE